MGGFQCGWGKAHEKAGSKNMKYHIIGFFIFIWHPKLLKLHVFVMTDAIHDERDPVVRHGFSQKEGVPDLKMIDDFSLTTRCMANYLFSCIPQKESCELFVFLF